MMRELGLDAYRFSLSWARILPNGLANKVSDAGVEFYNNYIDEMIKYGITPMVTLSHWDLPQKLQNLGGFVNPLFPEWFEDYARVVFKNFGDRVKHWITFNEPKEFCYQGYGGATKAPLLNITDVGTYYCARTLLLTHARAYRVYENEFKNFQGGTGDFIGVNHYTSSFVSATEHKRIHPVPSLYDDIDVGTYIPPEWPKSASPWLVQTPNSLYDALINLHERYNGPIFYIMENGWSSSPDADIFDDDRIRYYRAALNDALNALEDGVDLRGFMAWSLMDNFEWLEGYGTRFGLYRVNFSDPGRERTPRKSAFVYKQIIKSRVIDEEYDPETLDMTID
ncbi:unnamed protein product [Danaus chrysippus]|uniref:(African queen) hypothetical protein n=1 Tax=Danaus chrysippus TaxID=151541 RepID=A0A8J2QUU6_9NEOP|nr:unnamed protein product [Danaus chrysippus]